MPRIADVDVVESAESTTIQVALQMLEDRTLLGSEARPGVEGALAEELTDSKRHGVTRRGSSRGSTEVDSFIVQSRLSFFGAIRAAKFCSQQNRWNRLTTEVSVYAP